MTSPGAKEQTAEFIDLTQLLGLKAEAGDLLIGKLRGFPVGLKVTEANGAPLLLFQVRHLCPAKSDQVKTVRYAEPVNELMETKALDIDFDDRLAWLTFLNASAQLADGSLPSLVDSILASFAGAGLGGNDDLCHYCRRTPVGELSTSGGKVAQICPACLSEKQADFSRVAVKAGDGAISIAVLAPLAGAIGGIGWAGCWIGYELIFEKSGTGVIMVPHIAEAIAIICVALITGGPVGLIFRMVRRRGQALSVMFAVICAICSIIFGELLFFTWLIYHVFKVFSVDAAWRILPRMETEMGIYYFAVKLLSAVFAVVLAAQIAKPPKPRLVL